MKQKVNTMCKKRQFLHNPRMIFTLLSIKNSHAWEISYVKGIWKAFKSKVCKSCYLFHSFFICIQKVTARQACEAVYWILLEKDGIFTVSKRCSHASKICPFQTVFSWLPNRHGNTSKHFTWMHHFFRWKYVKKKGRIWKPHYTCVVNYYY